MGMDTTKQIVMSKEEISKRIECLYPRNGNVGVADARKFIRSFDEKSEEERSPLLQCLSEKVGQAVKDAVSPDGKKQELAHNYFADVARKGTIEETSLALMILERILEFRVEGDTIVDTSWVRHETRDGLASFRSAGWAELDPAVVERAAVVLLGMQDPQSISVLRNASEELAKSGKYTRLAAVLKEFAYASEKRCDQNNKKTIDGVVRSKKILKDTPDEDMTVKTPTEFEYITVRHEWDNFMERPQRPNETKKARKK